MEFRRIYLGFITSLLLISSANAMEPLTQAEKAASLEAFSQRAETNGIATAATIAEIEQSVRGTDEEQFMEGDKFVIQLMYAKDRNFPTMYGGTNYFNEDKSQAFYVKTKDMILKHYMGADYTKWSPKLLAVTEIVGVDATVSNSEELEALLEDHRIVRVEHIGLHSTVEVSY